jgi:hypothetical protein
LRKCCCSHCNDNAGENGNAQFRDDPKHSPAGPFQKVFDANQSVNRVYKPILLLLALSLCGFELGYRKDEEPRREIHR